jgi:hypothetical protein
VEQSKHTRLSKAKSEGVAEMAQIVYVQPIQSKHLRPRSDGVPEMKEMEYENVTANPQGNGIPCYYVSQTPQSQARIIEANTTNETSILPNQQSGARASVLGDASPKQDHQHRSSGTRYSHVAGGVDDSQIQSHDRSIPQPQILHQPHRNMSDTTANMHSTQVESSPGVRVADSDIGLVKMKKGRFKFLDGRAIPTLTGNKYSDGQGEQQYDVVTSVVSSTSAPSGNSQNNPNNPVMKKGRFVVLNVVESVQGNQESSSKSALIGSNAPHSASQISSDTVQASVNPGSSMINVNQSIVGSQNPNGSVNATKIENSTETMISQGTTGSTNERVSAPQDMSSTLCSTTSSEAATTEATNIAKENDSSLKSSNHDRNTIKPVKQQLSQSPSANIGEIYARPPSKTPIPGLNGGVGKVMYHLNVMQSELNDIDRVHKSLQTENKCLVSMFSF